MEGSVVTVINAYILYLGIKIFCSCCSSKIQLLGSSDYTFLVGSKISAVWLLIFSPLLLFSYNPLHNRLTRRRFFWMETFRYNWGVYVCLTENMTTCHHKQHSTAFSLWGYLSSSSFFYSFHQWVMCQALNFQHFKRYSPNSSDGSFGGFFT